MWQHINRLTQFVTQFGLPQYGGGCGYISVNAAGARFQGCIEYHILAGHFLYSIVKLLYSILNIVFDEEKQKEKYIYNAWHTYAS